MLFALMSMPAAAHATTFELRPVAGSPWALPGRDGTQLAVADLDGDGVQDVAVTDPARDAIRLLRGAALSADPLSFAAPLTPSSLATGDVDGDGRPELVAGTNGGPAIHVITAAGARPTIAADAGCLLGEPVAVDVLGDGRAEIVASHACGAERPALRVYGVDAGRAELLQALAGAGGDHPAVADLDGDGRNDVVTVRDGRIRVAKGSAQGLVPGATAAIGRRRAARDLAVGDIDGDRRPDVVVLLTNRTGRAITGESPAADPGLALLRGTGRGGLRAPRGAGFPVAEETYAIATADLNRDRRDDVLAPSAALAPGSVVLGGRRGLSHAAGEITGVDVTAADLDDDGRREVVTLDRDAATGLVRAWKAVPVRPGTARLEAPRACLRAGRLRLRVTGSRVASVVFRVRGGAPRQVVPRGGVAQTSAGLWRIPRAGTRVRATVAFATLQRPRTLSARVRRCR